MVCIVCVYGVRVLCVVMVCYGMVYVCMHKCAMCLRR